MYSGIKYSIFFAFLVFSMVTNVLGAITPLVISKFGLTLAQGGLLTFSFMISYLIVSIPAGLFSDMHGKKKTMLLGIAIMFFGLISFLFSVDFIMLLFSTLAAGIGVTFIQVGANTLIEEISKLGEYVKNLNITHALFGVGSFSIPLIVGFLLKNGYDWRIAYVFFTVLAVPLFFIAMKSKAPKHIKDEKLNLKVISAKLRDTGLMSFAFGLFLYVGTEMGIATWMILFLKNEHGISMETGIFALSIFWAMLAIGRFVGGHLTHKYSPKIMLSFFSIGAIVSLALSLFIKADIAIYLMPLMGFFLSIIFPTMFSVAIENTKNNKGIASGILMSSAGGGAIIPYIMGAIGDRYGLIASFSILFATLGYILLRAQTIRKKHIDIEKDLLKEPILETI